MASCHTQRSLEQLASCGGSPGDEGGPGEEERRGKWADFEGREKEVLHEEMPSPLKVQSVKMAVRGMDSSPDGTAD